MARTLNGNLTGKAAQLQRRDDALDFVTPREDCGNAMATLKALDPYWEAWYDTNVVEGPGFGFIAAQVWERVKYLRSFETCTSMTEAAPRVIISGGEVLEIDQPAPSTSADEVYPY